MMDQKEALAFIRDYFEALFIRHDVAILDVYLDGQYFDDDIGDPNGDHIQYSKEYLTELFKVKPTIGVDVNRTMVFDHVITAYLDWFELEQGQKKVFRKGVAIFVMNGRKILKRHTFIYDEDPPQS